VKSTLYPTMNYQLLKQSDVVTILQGTDIIVNDEFEEGEESISTTVLTFEELSEEGDSMNGNSVVKIKFETVEDGDDTEDDSESISTETYIIEEDDSIIMGNDEVEIGNILNLGKSRENMREARPSIVIAATSNSSKPSISGLHILGSNVEDSNLHQIRLHESSGESTFLCPYSSCQLRLPTKSSLSTHVQLCHKDTIEEENLDDPDECVADIQENEVDSHNSEQMQFQIKSKKGKVMSAKKYTQCQICDLRLLASNLRRHFKEEHENPKSYTCTECGLKVSRKYHLIRHIKAVHQQEKFWQCEDCDYKTNNQVSFKKHRSNKHDNGDDGSSIYSLEGSMLSNTHENELRCICTWCPFRSNRYSVVKKHIEIHHERKKHYPCKECVFIGQSVDDYAEHYHSFHKTDEYKHACTDCSFKCTNKQDLKVHYSETHNKERSYVCKMCDHKSTDLNNMKRHINSVHNSNTNKITNYSCPECGFFTTDRIQFLSHQHRDQSVGSDVEEPAMQIVLSDNSFSLP